MFQETVKTKQGEPEREGLRGVSTDLWPPALLMLEPKPHHLLAGRPRARNLFVPKLPMKRITVSTWS